MTGGIHGCSFGSEEYLRRWRSGPHITYVFLHFSITIPFEHNLRWAILSYALVLQHLDHVVVIFWHSFGPSQIQRQSYLSWAQAYNSSPMRGKGWGGFWLLSFRLDWAVMTQNSRWGLSFLRYGGSWNTTLTSSIQWMFWVHGFSARAFLPFFIKLRYHLLMRSNILLSWSGMQLSKPATFDSSLCFRYTMYRRSELR